MRWFFPFGAGWIVTLHTTYGKSSPGNKYHIRKEAAHDRIALGLFICFVISEFANIPEKLYGQDVFVPIGFKPEVDATAGCIDTQGLAGNVLFPILFQTDFVRYTRANPEPDVRSAVQHMTGFVNPHISQSFA
jgi:hypothetical protein